MVGMAAATLVTGRAGISVLKEGIDE